MIEQHAKETCGFDRDILEWSILEEVLALLLKDHSTGRNIIWATDDYAERGNGFCAGDEIRLAQIVDKDNPVIRPRIDKSAAEQRQRVVKRAEVFTPSWICNKQNNLVDAAWFGWKKPNASPFNAEIAKFDPETEFGWLFGRDVKTIGKHIANALSEELSSTATAEGTSAAGVPVASEYATTQHRQSATISKSAQVEMHQNPTVAKIATVQQGRQRGRPFSI